LLKGLSQWRTTKSVQHFEGGMVREIFIKEAITLQKAKFCSA